MEVRSLIGRFSLSLLGFDSHPVSKICCCTSPDAIPLFTHILALGVQVLSQGIKGNEAKQVRAHLLIPTFSFRALPFPKVLNLTLIGYYYLSSKLKH